MSLTGLNKLQGDVYGCYTALRAPTPAGQGVARLHPASPPEAQMHLHLPQLCGSGALQVSCWPGPALGCWSSMLQSVKGSHAGLDGQLQASIEPLHRRRKCICTCCKCASAALCMSAAGLKMLQGEVHDIKEALEVPHAGWADSCRPALSHSTGGANAFAPAANVQQRRSACHLLA